MTRPARIYKETATRGLLPNWTDYDDERRRFSWNQARLALQGTPGGGLNMGFEAVDRHAAGVLRYHTALRFVSKDAPALELSYAVNLPARTAIGPRAGLPQITGRLLGTAPCGNSTL